MKKLIAIFTHFYLQIAVIIGFLPLMLLFMQDWNELLDVSSFTNIFYLSGFLILLFGPAFYILHVTDKKADKENKNFVNSSNKEKLSKLIQKLQTCIDLLKEDGSDNWVENFEAALEQVENFDRRSLDTIRGFYGGMCSFSDGGICENAENEKRRLRLANEILQLVEELR